MFGIESQFDMAIEECSELIMAICHYGRNKANKNDIASEIADVEIMCNQLRLIIGDEIVEQHKKYKLLRLRNMLENLSSK